MKKLFFISLFIFFGEIVLATDSDSAQTKTDSSFVKYFQEYFFSPANQSFVTIDSSLYKIQNYFPENFFYSIFLSSRKTVFESANSIGFISGLEKPDLFGYNNDSIKYFQTRTPYTELFTLFGSKKEQFFKLIHTQNVSKNWNIAVNMLRVRSEGFYQHQNCADNNFSFSSNYKTKNNCYGFLMNGIFSSVKSDENGGVADDTDFEEGGLITKQQIPVNLDDASTKRGKRSFYLNQYINFGTKEKVMRGDSVVFFKVIPKNSISVSTHAVDSWFLYEDNFPKSGFYNNVIYDSLKTLDSIWLFQFENKITWTFFANKFFSKIYYLNSFNSVYNKLQNDSLIMNHIAGFSFQYDTNWKFNVQGEYIIDGINTNDFFIYGEAEKKIAENSFLSASGGISDKSPSYIFTKYYSNHFQWTNTFSKISETKAELNYSNSKYKFEIGGSYANIFNYVYFDSTFLPAQLNNNATVCFAYAEKTFHLKKFNFYNKIMWQKSSAKIIHLPEFVTNHSLYYESKWFKKAMDVQIGLDVRFNTEYFADAYMPALGQYYLQNEKKIGNYPFVDFFFNMKVNKARIFFKAEHFLSGLLGNTYYLAPHYPAPDRSFKIGVNWIFFD